MAPQVAQCTEEDLEAMKCIFLLLVQHHSVVDAIVVLQALMNGSFGIAGEDGLAPALTQCVQNPNEHVVVTEEASTLAHFATNPEGSNSFGFGCDAKALVDALERGSLLCGDEFGGEVDSLGSGRSTEDGEDRWFPPTPDSFD